MVRLASALSTTTAIGICALAPAIAWAQCAPNPTQAYTTTTCTGTDPGTLVANTNGSTVNVQAGASVGSIYATTVTVAGQTPPSNFITIADNGQITGGVTVDSGTVPAGSFASSIGVNLSVGANASIGGSTAIALIAETGPYTGTVSLILDNQGTIQSASGAAITSNGPASAQITNLINEASGSIGGIRAFVGSMTNNGAIIGGSGSAIDSTTTGYFYSYYTSWQNNGSITSNSSASTLIVAAGSNLNLANGGQITNSGSGAAVALQQLSTYNTPVINNLAGGTISSVGGSAITSNAVLTITNAGTISGAGYAINTSGELNLTSTGVITGAVEADNVGGFGASTINLSGGGSINGSLTLGATSQGTNAYSGNTLIVDYAGGANVLSSISGAVNIGGTNNGLFLNLPGSMTLNAPFALPTAFSTLGLQLAMGSTVTLASGFAAPTGLTLSSSSPYYYYGGSATLINNANFTTIGAALSNTSSSQIAITNTGTIVANLGNAPAGTYAVTAEASYGTIALTNSGTITGNGGNGAYVDSGVVNTGTISADGTALTIFNGMLTNSGTIAGGNTGLSLTGGSGTNTGTITGGQVGAALVSTVLTNSGTISTSGGGVAVGLGSYGILINQQGGVINGGVGASATTEYGFSSSVTNAGTINGNVNLGTSSYGQTNNTFTELAGGVLNGNLNLGSGGDKLVVALGSTDAGGYPGITGTVTGSGTETLVSLVTANASATLGAAGGVFSVFGYDLANNATLTLSSAGTASASYAFAGTGTVNLTADITGTGALALLNLNTASVQTDATGAQLPTLLNFTSNGNLIVASNLDIYSQYEAVRVGSGSIFTNNGMISYNNAAPISGYYGVVSAIANFGSVVNNGTISVGGISAIDGAASQSFTSVVNAGTIAQIAGAADGTGIIDINSVTNSGTIATGGNAVEFLVGYVNQLTNSGTITSTNGSAITSDPSGYYAATATIKNMTGGVIGGGTGQPAIALSIGSAVVNGGTINGDVQLGLSGYVYNTGSTYVANGGTLNGNLTFGGSNNTLLVVGNSTGVTGTIDIGTGTNNLYAQAYTASASVDLSAPQLPTGFQNVGIGAVGSGTVITVTGPAAGLNSGVAFFGDGTINNSANINASASGYAANAVILGGNLNTLLGLTSGLTFINSGTLADGVQGTVQTLTNSGTIGSSPYFQALTIAPTVGEAFQFNNSGQILGTIQFTQSETSGPTSVNFENSGTITGYLYGEVLTDQATFLNSGAMAAAYLTFAGTASGPTVPATSAFTNVTNTASGSLSGELSVYTTSPNVAVTNAGQIGIGLEIYQYANSGLDQASVSLVNSGSINGQVSVYAAAANVSVANSGSIAPATISGGVILSDTTLGNSTVSFSNSGTITTGNSGQSGVAISSFAGTTTAPATTAVTVTNSGTITANGGGQYNPFFAEQTITAGLAVNASAPGGSALVAITNAAGATISANGANSSGYGEYGYGTLPPSLVNGGSVALLALANTFTLTNAGIITGGTDTVPAGTYLEVPAFAQLPSGLTTLAGAIEVIADTASVTNTGTITGNSIIDATTSAFANYGTVNGNITLGTGAGAGTASFVEGINAVVTGTVTGTAATNTLTIDVTGGGTYGAALLAPFVGFGDPHLTGSGVVSFSGPLTLQTLVLDNAALTLAAGQVLQTAGPIALTGGIGTSTFTNYGTVDGAVVNINTINGAGGIINIATTATSSGSFANAAASAQLNIDSGTFTFTQGLTNSGTIAVADGATLVAAGIVNNQGGVITVQSGGTIDDALVNAGTVTNRGTYYADITNQAGATFITSGAVTAPDAIDNAGVFSASGGTISTPVFNNLAGGTLAGSPAFITAGGTLLTNQGTISGNVTFGAGANELLLGSGSQITGTVTGGSGTNLLAIMSSATDAAPDQFNLTGVTGFQQSQMLSGSVALSGTYTTGTFAVLGGHLIGNSGSILNAGTITVASGAAFGSAGTVNGNVVVRGTLTPVATMTVNGNVALATGSTALFATSNGQIGKLVVAGQVNIATGATLSLSPTVRQGSVLTLITAGGGINGTFANANLPGSFDVLQSSTTLKVYDPFVADASFHPGATAALDTINGLVVSGRANTALVASLPTLDTAQGVADAAKFARLTPEPYATATQIGIDNGLQITNAVRDFDNDALQSVGSGKARVFTFGQALGNWTHASGNQATGSSNASNATGGLLAGLGWRGDHAMITVFGGGIHGQQTIAALGASTLAHSSVFGGSAMAWTAGFDASAMIAYNNGSGATTRVLPDGTSAWGHYGLNTMVADVTVGYAMQGPSDWSIHPQVGLTHIVTHRKAADELGSTAFALDVEGERRKLDFLDGGLRIAPPVTAQSRFAPWASLGFRVRLGSDNTQAIAFLPDATEAIAAGGVLRARTVATGKVGLSYALSHAVTLYGAFDGEAGSGGNDKAVNGGLRISF